MRTVVLPGYSPHNKDWAEEIKEKLDLGHEVMVHNWEHWQKGGALSAKKEVSKILEEVDQDKVNIIAKSVGTFITILLIPYLKGQVDKIILCGIPSVSKERKEKFKESLKDYPTEKIICFQNFRDPLATFEEVKSFMKDVNPKIKVVRKERGDHNYPYLEDFKEFLTS